MRRDKLNEIVKASGMRSWATIRQEDIVYDVCFRQICESNKCGHFGKCWMCPPDVGTIDSLMGKAKQFNYSIIFQNVFQLEDSYDFEGMNAAIKSFVTDILKIRNALLHMEKEGDISPEEYFLIGVGACGICEVCAKIANEKCRFPDLAFPSFETCGIFVSETAKRVGLKYNNGTNTVTYFGALFFNDLKHGCA